MNSNKLVDFIYIGVSKTGSTALFKMLVQHPNINAQPNKEIGYFDLNHDRPVKWYEDYFLEKGDNVLNCEATVNYFESDLNITIPRMLKYNPDMKIACMLRNPIDRIISRYLHFRQQHYIWSLPPDDQRYVLESNDMDGWFNVHFRGETRLLRDIISDKRDGVPCKYFDPCIYHSKIKQLKSMIRPENLLISLYEDFKEDNARYLNDIFKFNNLEEVEVSGMFQNCSGFHTSIYDAKPEISAGDVLFIKDYFDKYNNMISEELGIYLDWNHESKWYDKIKL